MYIHTLKEYRVMIYLLKENEKEFICQFGKHYKIKGQNNNETHDWYIYQFITNNVNPFLKKNGYAEINIDEYMNSIPFESKERNIFEE